MGVTGSCVESVKSLPQIADSVANVRRAGNDARRIKELEDDRLIDDAFHRERHGYASVNRHRASEVEVELIGVRRRRLGRRAAPIDSPPFSTMARTSW